MPTCQMTLGHHFGVDPSTTTHSQDLDKAERAGIIHTECGRGRPRSRAYVEARGWVLRVSSLRLPWSKESNSGHKAKCLYIEIHLPSSIEKSYMVSRHPEHLVLGADVTESDERKSDESVTKGWVSVVQIPQVGAHIAGSVIFWGCPDLLQVSDSNQ